MSEKVKMENSGKIPMALIRKQLENYSQLDQLANRHQVYHGHRRSTDESRLPAENDQAEQQNSPGPGQYLDIYENSTFKNKSSNKHNEIAKKQEFGSQQPRFEGPAENLREQSKNLGPGSYIGENHISNIKKKRQVDLVQIGMKQRSPRKDERYEYIAQNISSRMKTPGLYNYDNEKKKRSHNRSNNPAFVNGEKRFSKSLIKVDVVPGPGHYNVADEGTSSISQFHTYV